MDLFEVAVSVAGLQFLVCDEVQFYEVEQCDHLARVVDELGVDVFAFGLITDFRGLLFDGTRRMLEIADERVEMQVETRCWWAPGRRTTPVSSTTCSSTRARPSSSATPRRRPTRRVGDVVRYELLCRRHYLSGDTGATVG